MAQITRVIDLNFVTVTPTAAIAYASFCVTIALALEELGLGKTKIPDERGETMPDGSLKIFVDIPGKARVEFTIPEGEWEYNGQN